MKESITCVIFFCVYSDFGSFLEGSSLATVIKCL